MLTSEQKATLKAHITNTPELAALPNNSDGAFAVAAVLNAAASPAFYVWRTSVDVSEIMLNGFDWTRVDNLSVGKARIWEWMVANGTIRPFQANVRAGVNACFAAAGDAANRLAVFEHSQRLATVAEKLFATGSGTTTTNLGVGPAVMGFEGQLSYQDVDDARNS